MLIITKINPNRKLANILHNNQLFINNKIQYRITNQQVNIFE